MGLGPRVNNEAIIGCHGRPLDRAKFTLTLAKSCLVRRLNALRENSNKASEACSNECIEKCLG